MRTVDLIEAIEDLSGDPTFEVFYADLLNNPLEYGIQSSHVVTWLEYCQYEDQPLSVIAETTGINYKTMWSRIAKVKKVITEKMND